MFISKEQLSCHVCASGPDRERVLQYICFCEDGAVSCNGHALLVVPYPVQEESLFKGTEAIVDALYQLPAGEQILIHRDQAKQIASAFFSGSVPPEVTLATLADLIAHKSITMANPEQKISKEFSITSDGSVGDFPDYRKLLPRSYPTMEVTFRLSLLVDLLTQIKKAGKGMPDHVTMKFHGEKGMVGIEREGEESRVVGYIMPFVPKDDKEEKKEKQE